MGRNFSLRNSDEMNFLWRRLSLVQGVNVELGEVCPTGNLLVGEQEDSTVK